MAVFMTFLSVGDTVMGLDLAHGGHLTHGSPVNFSGQLYNFVNYQVDKNTGRVDFDNVRALAKEHKPKMIICGGSAYPRFVEFEIFHEIAAEIGAFLMADIAHPSGLIAAGVHPSPVPYCDVITSTTHKTLRGPRGGIVLSNNEEIGKLVDKAVFPGLQGGPLMHVIAAKAAAFKEALSGEFKEYSLQTLNNAKALCSVLKNKGFEIVSGDTDCHMLLVNLTNKGVTGKLAENTLDKAGITCNKNSVPFDEKSPFITSGIRLGTAAGTTRGFKEKEFIIVGELISEVIDSIKKSDIGLEQTVKEVSMKVVDLCKKFPLYK